MKPYWKTEDPAQTTGARVVALLTRHGFPTVDTEERAQFADWWNALPAHTLDEIADEDAELAFEATAYVQGPMAALKLYQRAGERKRRADDVDALCRARLDARSRKEELEAAQKTLEAAQLEILRLKAEIYDLHYEARAGA